MTLRSPIGIPSFRRGLVVSALLVVGLVTAFSLLSDIPDLLAAFRQFTWWLLLPVVLLTMWNFGLRFVKWHLYLRALGIWLPHSLNLQIFLAGFAMLLTPGKVGEVIKAIYVRRYTGAPASRTSAAVAAERITDALAMLILAVVGATQYAEGRLLLLVLGAVAAVGIIALQHPVWLTQILHRADRLPIIGQVVHHGVAFIEASSSIFRPSVLLRATAISVLSWSGECLAFFLILIGLGIESSPRVLLVATFILAVSSLAGGASMVPGGLGIADASIAGLLILLLAGDEMTTSIAAAATIVIRFATLWFAMILGVVAMISLQRRIGDVEITQQPVQSTSP